MHFFLMFNCIDFSLFFFSYSWIWWNDYRENGLPYTNLESLNWKRIFHWKDHSRGTPTEWRKFRAFSAWIQNKFRKEGQIWCTEARKKKNGKKEKITSESVKNTVGIDWWNVTLLCRKFFLSIFSLQPTSSFCRFSPSKEKKKRNRIVLILKWERQRKTEIRYSSTYQRIYSTHCVHKNHFLVFFFLLLFTSYSLSMCVCASVCILMVFFSFIIAFIYYVFSFFIFTIVHHHHHSYDDIERERQRKQEQCLWDVYI